MNRSTNAGSRDSSGCITFSARTSSPRRALNTWPQPPRPSSSSSRQPSSTSPTFGGCAPTPRGCPAGVGPRRGLPSRGAATAPPVRRRCGRSRTARPSVFCAPDRSCLAACAAAMATAAAAEVGRDRAASSSCALASATRPRASARIPSRNTARADRNSAAVNPAACRDPRRNRATPAMRRISGSISSSIPAA